MAPVSSRSRRRRAVLLAGATVTLAASSGALAAGSGTVFWANNDIVQVSPSGSSLSRAALDGSGGATIFTSAPQALASTIDPQAGRIIWAGAPFIQPGQSGSVGVDGANPQALPLPSGTVSDPTSLTAVPSTGRMYWANDEGSSSPNEVRWAALDGSAHGVLYAATDLPAGVMDGPVGVAADPASGRIYWVNYNNGGAFTVGYANLDGSGGGGLITPQRGGGTGCTASGNPQAMIVDSAAGKLYFDHHPIRRMNLDGTGCEQLPDGISGPGEPRGLALDPANQRLYFGTGDGDAVRSVNLADNTTALLNTTGAATSHTVSPVLFMPPTVAPTVTGDPAVGATLSCAAHAAADMPGINMYRSASTTAYSWSRDGVAVPGATGPTLVASSAGSYVCTVTAANAEGSAVASATALAVAAPAANGPGGGAPTNPLGDGATVPSTLAKAGLPVSADGVVRLPLSCPAGLPGRCTASGYLTITTSVQVPAEHGKSETAVRKRTRVIARFSGFQIASGTTALNDVRLRRRIYAALRKAGVRRTPADLHITTSVTGEDPVTTSQRIWLRIPPLKKRVPVTG